MKKIITNILILILITYTLISTYVLSQILPLGILSNKYLILIFTIYLITQFIGYCVIFSKYTNILIKIIVGIFTIIGILISLFTLNYLNVTNNAMNNILAKDHQLDTYYVIVNNETKYEEIKDLKDKTIGIYENDSINYDKAIKDINKTINIKEIKKDNLIDIGKMFKNKEIDSLLVNSSNLENLENNISGFSENYKKIYEIEYKITTEKLNKEVNVQKQSFNVLISGVDIYGKISNVSNSDVNIVATVNPNTHEILLTVIPRDYYVHLHGKDGIRDKLTHAGVYGINTSVKTIENLLDIDINYYVRVNFTTLIKAVDTIGGVTIYNDIPFKHKYYFKKGEIHLNGDMALSYSRERKQFASGDVQRGKNQQKVLTAIINKVTTSNTIIKNYKDIMNTLSSSFETNLSKDEIYSLINLQIDKMPKWNVKSINVTGYDSSNYTYSYKRQLLYVMEPNYETVKKATAKIKETMDQIS